MVDIFEIGEKLYRAVRPEQIKEDGSLSSAAFKTSKGCSVDRGDGRTDQEAAKFMRKKLSGDIYRINVGDCYEKEIFIHYEPLEDDPYHSGLYRNEEMKDMTTGQCRHLTRLAVKVEESNNI